VKSIFLICASLLVFSVAAHAQYYNEKWQHHPHHERYWETVCKPEFRGYDVYGRPIYREVCWQEERWR
jgi:hypothetical protein